MPLAPRTSRRGFTLVEALCTIVILGVLGSLISSLILRSSRSYIEVAQRAQLHSELAAAMDRIERELREIPLTSGTTSPAIASVRTDSITWTRSGVSCSLSLSGTNLMLTDTTGAAAVLLADVTSVAVSAYDESNAVITLPAVGGSTSSVRRVQVTITTARNGISDTLRMKVFIRSTMEGSQG